MQKEDPSLAQLVADCKQVEEYVINWILLSLHTNCSYVGPQYLVKILIGVQRNTLNLSNGMHLMDGYVTFYLLYIVYLFV